MTKLLRATAFRAGALSLALSAAILPAAAQNGWNVGNDWNTPFGGALILAGHAGVDLLTTMRRFAVRVTGIGEADADGNIWSFTVDMTDLRPNELRSWRLTFVSGALFAYVFQVRANEGTTVTVTSLDGPLNGIAIGDGMLVEQVQMQRPAPQMRGAAGT
ncbi:MAG: hypothetical protein IT534_14650 [Bauldia sp.]|nr:hypothetical protein [Bauldia sp.]